MNERTALSRNNASISLRLERRIIGRLRSCEDFW
jgi:hypothetical protein